MTLSPVYTKTKSKISMNTFNKQNADIQFTKEIEKNGRIPFLDCLVTCDNKRMTFYRKQPYTDRLLDQSLHNLISLKATIIWILMRQAQLVCDSPDSLQDETDYLYNLFSKKNYNADFVRQNTHNNIGPMSTLALLCQRLYHTSEAPLKLSHLYYKLAMSVLHPNLHV